MLVTTEQLGSFLKVHAGQNRICTVTSLTPVKMNKFSRDKGPNGEKTPNPFMVGGEVIVDHLQERLVNFGADYEKAVNRIWGKNPGMVDEEGFIPYFAAESLWKGRGERINNYMARHKETGEEYLVYLQAIRGERNISLRQEAWVHRLSGSPVALADMLPYMPPKAAPSAKQRVDEGNVEIAPRTIHIENVLSIRSKIRVKH